MAQGIGPGIAELLGIRGKELEKVYKRARKA